MHRLGVTATLVLFGAVTLSANAPQITACGLSRKLTICGAQSVDSTHSEKRVFAKRQITPQADNHHSADR
jgi:hypothetical protein